MRGSVCWSLVDDIDSIVSGVQCTMEMTEWSGNDPSTNQSSLVGAAVVHGGEGLTRMGTTDRDSRCAASH